jgi:hypothetical protein
MIEILLYLTVRIFSGQDYLRVYFRDPLQAFFALKIKTTTKTVEKTTPPL